MPRPTVSDIQQAGAEDRAEMRARHGVRLVEPGEEGTSVQQLPDGVYGFTYSPAVAAPLFRTFGYRAFEIHRTRGDVLVIGFVTKADAGRLASASKTVTIAVHHDREGDVDTIVAVPYSRIARHRQYSIRNTPGIELEIAPAG